MNLKKYLGRLGDSVNKALAKYLPSPDNEPKNIHMAMRYSVFSGGKRIRPIITLECCRVCGGSVSDAMPAACAVELIHTYSLIHDDLPSMDDDDYRRGKPACHKAFGEANAILAGDALLTLAFGVIAKRLNPKIAAIATLELADAIGTSGLVGGQAADLEFKGRITSLKSLNYINNLKTARLFEASARIGAIIAENGGERYIDAMAAFGAYLGRAFQIIDDVLDREGYAKASGVKKAREDAGRLIFGAKKALDIFGLKAGRLKDIADYILSRQT